MPFGKSPSRSGALLLPQQFEQGNINNKAAIFSTTREVESANGFAVIAYEVGHSLGQRPITTPINKPLLMNPAQHFDNIIISSETLVDLAAMDHL